MTPEEKALYEEAMDVLTENDLDGAVALFAKLAGQAELVAYILQDDKHNQLTPRIVDIGYTSFMNAHKPNSEDAGPTDWITDTRPIVLTAIEKIKRDLSACVAPLH